MKFDKLGWVVAAALAGGIVGVGFQGSSVKIGTVDIAKALQDSDVIKKLNEEIQVTQTARNNALTFFSANRAMAPADLDKYATLVTKKELTPAEKTEMERIAQDATAATTKQRDLSTKNPLTDADKKQLEDYSSRVRQNQEILQRVVQAWEGDLQSLQASQQKVAIDRARAAVKEVSGKQGFSVVFSMESAPYSPNDVTTDVTKVLSKAK